MELLWGALAKVDEGRPSPGQRFLAWTMGAWDAREISHVGWS